MNNKPMSNVFNTKQSEILYAINNLCNQFIGTSSTASNINCAAQLVPVLTGLTEAIARLADNISELSTIFTNVGNTANHSNNQSTYAGVVGNTQSRKNIAETTNLNAVQNAKHITAPQSKTREHIEDDFLNRLALLKNTRNEACFRMRRNQMLSALYNDNLQSQVIKVPKKCMPNMVCHGDQALQRQRNRNAIQNVNNEIAVMKIHEDRQKQKMNRYDRMARELIASVPDESKRKTTLGKYEEIVAKSNEAIERRLAKTIDFLKGSNNMEVLHEAQQIQYAPESSYINEVGSADTCDQDMPSTNNLLKRRRDNSTSTSLQSNAVQDKVSTGRASRSQPLPKRLTNRHVISSKNWVTPGWRGRPKSRAPKS